MVLFILCFLPCGGIFIQVYSAVLLFLDSAVNSLISMHVKEKNICYLFLKDDGRIR